MWQSFWLHWYHLEQCLDEGWTRERIDEAMTVALMVGGSLAVPRARHAAETPAYLEGRA